MPVNKLTRPNAYLSYKDDSGRLQSFVLWITEYSQDHKLSGQSAQTFSSRRFYPRSYAPGRVIVRGRLRNSAQQAALGKFVRTHQVLMLNNAGHANIKDDTLTLMNFGIPTDGFYVGGYIPSFTVKRERFKEHGAEFGFDFEVIRDRHSTNSGIIPARAMKAWFTGSIIDVGSARTFKDDTLVGPVEIEEVPGDDGIERDENGIVQSPIPGTIPGAGGRLTPPNP